MNEKEIQNLKDSVKALDLKLLSIDELNDLWTKTNVLVVDHDKPSYSGYLKVITKGLVLTKYPPNGDNYLNTEFCLKITGKDKSEIIDKVAEFLRRLEITPRWPDDRPNTFFKSLCDKLIKFKFDTIKELTLGSNHIYFCDESGLRIEFESLIHYDITI